MESKGEVSVGGEKAALSYSPNSAPSGGGVYTIVLKHNGDTYEITYSVSRAYLDEYPNDLENILASFVFLK